MEQRKHQVIPASHDILCGSGGHVNGHEGNQMFRQVLRRHHSGYINATTKPQKMRISHQNRPWRAYTNRFEVPEEGPNLRSMVLGRR